MADTPTGPPGGTPPGGGGNRFDAGGYQGPSNFGPYSQSFQQSQRPQAPEPVRAPSTGPDMPSADILKDLTKGDSAKMGEALAAQAAFLDAYKKKMIEAAVEMGKLSSPENVKKHEEALARYMEAYKIFTETNTKNTDYLSGYVKSLEKATEEMQKGFRMDPAKTIQTTLEKLTQTIKGFQDSSGILINKIISGTLSNRDLDTFYRTLDEAAKVQKIDATKLKADFARQLKAARNAGSAQEQTRLATDAIKSIQSSAEGIKTQITKDLENFDKTLGKREAWIKSRLDTLDLKGKATGLEAKLLRFGATTTVRESGTLEKLTGGANKGFGGKYVKEGGGFDHVAIQAQLLKNIGEAGALAAKTYRATGSEFGAMDRGVGGHLSAASAYKSHKSDMAGIGLMTGRTADQAAATFDQVAGTMRVGTRDITERKKQLDEMTKTTIKLSNATGLQETEILDLSKAYRDNLGKSAKESADAGYSVAKALSTINKDLSEDLQISGKQIHAIFSSLASDSSSFGKDIKEMNFWAEKSANQFAKMGLNATKMKQDIIDIAKLQTGGLTTGAGVTGEIALSGGIQNLMMDRQKAAELAGGEKNLQEFSKLGDTEFAMKVADEMEKQGKKDEAKAIRDQDAATKGSSSAFLKASMTGDTATWLGTRSNKEAQEGAASIRGNDKLSKTLGLKNMDEIYNKMDDDARAAGNSTVLGAATGETGPERRLRELRRMMSKASTPEEKKKIQEQMEGVKEQVDKSSGGAAATDALLDPMKALTTALTWLNGNVLLNTAALIANTLMMFKGGRGGGIGLGGGSGISAAGGAAEAAKAVEAAKAAEAAAKAPATALKGTRTTRAISESAAEAATNPATRAERIRKAVEATKARGAAKAARIAEASEAVKTAEAAATAAEAGKSAGWLSRIPGVGKVGEMASKIPGAAKIAGIGAKGLKAIPILGEIAMLGEAAYKPFAQMNDKDYATRSLGEQLKHGFSGATESFGESGKNFKEGNWGKGLLHGAWGALQGVFEAPAALTSTMAQQSTKAGWYDATVGKLLGATTRSDDKSTDNQMQADEMIRALRSKTGKTKKYDFSNMSPEEREKYAKELEGKKKELQEAEKSTFGTGLLTGRTDKYLQQSLQSSLADVQKKAAVSWDQTTAPLGKKEGSPANLYDKQAQEALSGVRSLEADMGYNPGTNEIIFKVTDASKVMLKSLNQEFRNTAHA